jgi:hypothetical protein
LLYQLLLNHYRWAYFSAFTDLFHRIPITAFRLLRRIGHEPRGYQYTSSYGVFRSRDILETLWSPTEGHPVWSRWLPPRPTHHLTEKLTDQACQEMRATVTGFSALAGRPFLNKNPQHCVRLLPLTQAYPRALLIVLHRESLYVAQSLYVARTRTHRKNPRVRWWGTKPKEYDRLKVLDYVSQAAGQTRAIERELAAQLGGCDNPRLEVTYEEMCRDPGGLLLRIEAACRREGISLHRTIPQDPPPFRVRDTRKVPRRAFARLKERLQADLPAVP